MKWNIDKPEFEEIPSIIFKNGKILCFNGALLTWHNGTLIFMRTSDFLVNEKLAKKPELSLIGIPNPTPGSSGVQICQISREFPDREFPGGGAKSEVLY